MSASRCVRSGQRTTFKPGDPVAAALRPEHGVGADDVHALGQVARHQVERLDLDRADVHHQVGQPRHAAQVAQHVLHVLHRHRQHQDLAGGDLGQRRALDAELRRLVGDVQAVVDADVEPRPQVGAHEAAEVAESDDPERAS